MPGYVIHMAAASRVIEEKGISISSFKDAFLLGNIIPDAMARTAKKESHFWDDETYGNLNRIPNIEDFIKKYGHRLDEPFVLGYYSHLLLDNLFVKEYWKNNFTLLDKEMKPESRYDLVRFIRLKKDNQIYEREHFLSDDMYYGDYDRMYPYIFDRYPFVKLENLDLDCISVDEIDKAQVATPLSDMIEKMNKLYDNRANIIRKDLKVFELEQIYTLVDRVVSDVCEYMSHSGQ